MVIKWVFKSLISVTLSWTSLIKDYQVEFKFINYDCKILFMILWTKTIITKQTFYNQ